MSIRVIDAVLEINPSAVISVSDNNIDSIQWLNGTTPISKADIEAKMVELQTEYDNNKYQRDRAVAYPSIGDQLDMIYHAGQGGDVFQKAIKAIKDKYPKE